MSQIHIYGSDPEDLDQAKNYANRLRQQRPDLEDGSVFTDFHLNQRRDLWDRTEGRELLMAVNPGDVVVVARHTDFWTVKDAKRVRENWTHRGMGVTGNPLGLAGEWRWMVVAEEGAVGVERGL